MSNKRKACLISSTVMNLLNFAFVLACVISFFIRTGDGNMQVKGAVAFRYFTIDSNVFSAIASLLLAIFEILILCKKKENTPVAISLLKFMGTIAVAVTFFTVLLFLGPTQGYQGMYDGTNAFLHLICPLLVMFSYLFTEFGLDEKYNTFIEPLFGLGPVLVYGIVYMVLVVGTKTWEDFYGFNRGDMWYVSFIAMFCATYLLGLGHRALHNLIGKHLIKE